MSASDEVPDRRPGPFDLPNVATALLDAQGSIVGWSEAAEGLLGYLAPDVVGRPAKELLVTPLQERAGEFPQNPSRAKLITVRHSDGHPMNLAVERRRMSSLAGEGNWLLSGIDLDATPWWQVSQSVLERFLDRSPYGMAVVDTDLRYLWLNQTMERMAGVPRERRLGQRMSGVLPLLQPEAVEAQMQRTLDTGQSVLDFHYHGHIPADPEREHAFSTSFFRLDDAEGKVMGVCYMGVDVTERWRARQRLALLTESGGRIGSTLDISRTAQELADVAVPKLADLVVVDLLESVLLGEEPAAVSAHNSPPLRRAAQQSLRDGCPEAVVSIGQPSRYPPSSPIARCLVDGRSVIEPTPSTDTQRWLDDDPLRAASVRDFGLRSLMVVPLRARGVTLGVTVLFRHRSQERFNADDLQLAEEFVSRAAVCLDNARRYTRERTAALTLQRSLLPQALPVTDTVETTSRYLPANGQDSAGGDWFDVIGLSGARVALVVGDVVGHGINAAATMGRLRTAVHTLAVMDLPPDELLAHLDDLVVRLIDEEASGDGAAATAVLGATCLYAVYDPVTQKCSLARAGHLPPAIVTPDGSVSFPSLPAGPPLGLGSMPFESVELDIPEGSLLALFTDGLIESRDRDLDDGLNRLKTALAGPDRSLEEICDHVLSELLTVPQSDDLALLVARTHALGSDHVASWDLPSDPAFVAQARALATDTLSKWDLEELHFTTELIVSELVTNAIRHAVGPVRLRLIRQSGLICEVSDGSSTSPRLRHARTTDEGGRGMFLIAQLTRRWGTRYTPTGKIIWAEQGLP